MQLNRMRCCRNHITRARSLAFHSFHCTAAELEEEREDPFSYGDSARLLGNSGTHHEVAVEPLVDLLPECSGSNAVDNKKHPRGAVVCVCVCVGGGGGVSGQSAAAVNCGNTEV